MRAKRNVDVIHHDSVTRLAPGRHASPREGVCVVELASLIAGEEFSDRPDCVCPVIGAFLRGWNDRAAHAERQRLSPYAARIVGSRGTREATRERRDICLEWAGAELRRGRVRRALSKARIRLRIALFCGLRAAVRPNEGAGDYAARVAFATGETERAFELLDNLLALGGGWGGDHPALAAIANGNGRMHGNGRPATGDNGIPAVTSNGAPAGNGSVPSNGSNGRPSASNGVTRSGSKTSSRPKVTAAPRS